jgi:tetratricopeptide (TPR) repeat protein
LRAASQLGQRGDLAGAQELCQRSLALYPTTAGWNALGVFRAQAGENAEASAAFEQALRINPDHAGALQGMAVVLLREGRPGEALALLDRVRELAPGAPMLERQRRLAREGLAAEGS